MNENQIREHVRSVLHEIMQQGQAAFYVNAGGNNFPYESEDDIVKLPSDINTQEDYLVNWNGISDNQDLYNFPMEEFKKGIQVEKAKNDVFNILDLSKIVINNLGENPRFYSNLGV